MYIKSGPNRINLDGAKAFYSKPYNDGVGTRPGIEIVWQDDRIEALPCRVEDVEALLGTIVPAPVALSVIEARKSSGGSVDFVTLPVVAYRIHGSREVTPITPNGEPTAEAWATVLPDNSCLDLSTGATQPLDQWKARFAPAPAAAKRSSHHREAAA